LFANLSFDLVPGGLTALVGPSGSGKSTLLGLLAGWTRPDDGTIERAGVEKVAWVFQNPHGVRARTVLDHVTLPVLAQGLDRTSAEDRAVQVLAGFGLADFARRPFRELSGGEAQRLMLARAVAVAPDLMLVDEPTAQLDRANSSSVIDVLGRLGGAGMIVVISTHDSRVIDACDSCVDLGQA
jgi:ABC-type lipoprotein export system ATPase subunit